MAIDLFAILKQTSVITLFVLSMMLIIEYLNVFTKGLWSKGVENDKWKQVVLGAVLGIIPGCLGAYTAVSLYVHNIFGIGALVSTMIATSGDEAFLMFSVIPQKALILHVVLFATAIVAGIAVNFFYKKERGIEVAGKHFHIHEVPECNCFERNTVFKQILEMTPVRALMLFIIVFSFTALFLEGSHEQSTLHQIMSIGAQGEHHEHPKWVKITFLSVLLFSLFVVLTVNDHFLEKHLWGHIIKKHFLKIFLWTFGTLLFVSVINQFYDLHEIIGRNLFWVLIVAVLVGIIPESGPHMIFVLLFANGTIPFSILLASSIVQDGHGSLPLLAESRKGFAVVKLLNILTGLLVGGGALALGF